MGIRGLKRLIKSNAAGAFKDISFEYLRGSVIAIDSSILLYKYRYIYDTDDFHLIGFKQEIKKMKNYGIIPIYVFDGTPPEAKLQVLKSRSDEKNKMKDKVKLLKESIPPGIDEMIDSDGDTPELVKMKKIKKQIEKIEKKILYVNKKHSLEVIELLKDLGIAYFQSPGEAEKSCAILQKTGKADYVLTEDTDSLTFGATKVLFNIKNDLVLCDLEIILQTLGLTQLEFVDLCILCGCDYTCSIPKCGPVNALKMINKYRNIDAFIDSGIYVIPDTFDYQIARQLFNE